jgi:hypothetical protein
MQPLILQNLHVFEARFKRKGVGKLEGGVDRNLNNF